RGALQLHRRTHRLLAGHLGLGFHQHLREVHTEAGHHEAELQAEEGGVDVRGETGLIGEAPIEFQKQRFI
ncbi:hypothetical protein AVEN_45470-1, partial [Araneus ventricosus]